MSLALLRLGSSVLFIVLEEVFFYYLTKGYEIPILATQVNVQYMLLAFQENAY